MNVIGSSFGMSRRQPVSGRCVGSVTNESRIAVVQSVERAARLRAGTRRIVRFANPRVPISTSGYGE